MFTSTEIIDLFSRLALRLQSPSHTLTSRCKQEVEEESINLSISKLNQSLNLNEESSVRVLDTALSLMCFEAPKVFDSIIDYSVKTIISVLSGSISCKVLRFRNEEVLQIGSSISRHNCEEVIEACTDILGKLEGSGGMIAQLLLRAVVRVAVLGSCYRISFPFMVSLDVTSINERSTALSKLHCHLPSEFSLQNDEIPLRLFLWYLDPLILKHNISEILQDILQRPFLCLTEEFQERNDWRAVAICLALSPVIFVETRALLHNWFLLTGLAFVLELLIGLVSVILDIILCPSPWGMSLELGSKLPFSTAYFPFNDQFVRTLAGPLSIEGLLCIVRHVSNPVLHAKQRLDPTVNLSASNIGNVDHRSIWALAISFPDWFYFASVLLFAEKSFQETFHSTCTLWPPEIGIGYEEPASIIAARYISWILSPVDKSKQELLLDFFMKMSEVWSQKRYGSGKSHEEETGYRKKLKKSKYQEKVYTPENECCSQMIGFWLREFERLYLRNGSKSVKNSASCDATGSHGFAQQQGVMFRRIPLGIFIGFLNCIDEEGCAMLLHYAATGKINQMNLGSVEFSKKEAVAGACLVFHVTCIAERMSASLFNTDEGAVDLMSQVKVKANKYLIKCVKRLIMLDIDEVGVVMLKDLSRRLRRWRHQGQVVVRVDKDMDDIIDLLSKLLYIPN